MNLFSIVIPSFNLYHQFTAMLVASNIFLTFPILPEHHTYIQHRPVSHSSHNFIRRCPVSHSLVRAYVQDSQQQARAGAQPIPCWELVRCRGSGWEISSVSMICALFMGGKGGKGSWESERTSHGHQILQRLEKGDEPELWIWCAQR